MKRLPITYGQSFTGLGFGAATYSSKTNLLHLVTFDSWNRTAKCGKVVIGTPLEFATGAVCGACIEAAGLTADDLLTDEAAPLLASVVEPSPVGPDRCPGCSGSITFLPSEDGGVTVGFVCADEGCQYGKAES